MLKQAICKCKRRAKQEAVTAANAEAYMQRQDRKPKMEKPSKLSNKGWKFLNNQDLISNFEESTEDASDGKWEELIKPLNIKLMRVSY